MKDEGNNDTRQTGAERSGGKERDDGERPFSVYRSKRKQTSTEDVGKLGNEDNR